MKNKRRLGIVAAALVALVVLAATAVEAMHGTDIILTPGGAGARLHSSRYREGWKSYDVNADGTGFVIFYRRAESAAGGYPRGAVIDTWVYQLDDEPFNTGDGTMADSVAAFSAGGTATKVIVRPIK